MQLFAFVLASFAASVFAADPLVINTPIKDNGDIIGDNDLIFDTSYPFSGEAAPAGTTVVFVVSDFSGDQASTAPIVVSNSSDSSCFPHSA
ncbi:hypothetical protein GSI_08633 [Ganoderma sinense ZZ0214-1]|uniref:Uncharacterized protein n=1 Tax=Ganoderma sinense ZZ0214-1 TaxID=1077348 RepID=A0A2G8S498_9APHY|nr:hypothetical protein GSI_08633 [Ganoderma sinense ZZ0214-1]